MVPTNSSWMLVAGLGLLTGAAGGVFGALLLVDSKPRVHESVPTPTIDDSAFEKGVAVLRDLTSEVRLLRASMQTSVPHRPEDPATQRVPMETAQSERLERALERIAAALEAQRPFAAGVEVAAGPARAPFKPKDAILLEALRATDAGIRSRPYYFWSMDEILEQFGCPDKVSGVDGGGWSLFYTVGEEGWVNFYFIQRMLTEIGTDLE